MFRRGFGKLALVPAFFVCTLLAAGQLRAQDTRASPEPVIAAGAKSAPAPAFDVEIDAPPEIKDLLQRHLELLRYRELADLDNTELDRLLLAAERNARDLLATLGYFSAEVTVRLQVAAAGQAVSRQVVIAVQPGPPTRIGEVAITFTGDIVEDATATRQRRTIRANWSLTEGMRFTQTAWDDAKAGALRLLGAERYPVGQIVSSRADIDPDTKTARLSVMLDSGPAYRLGGLQIKGLENYDRELVERLARLGPGSDYDRTRMLEAQQRLQDSGYFDSVFLTLDTSGDPLAAPVLVTLREAKRKKIVLGVGTSTDSGPRLSVEHTNHQLPVIGWRAVSKLLLDRDTQSIGTELTAQPDEQNWRWVTSVLLKNENAASVDVRSQTLRAGRTQSTDRIDRNVYLQYERANTTSLGVATLASAISANYAWTQRNFDSLPFPTRGYGLGVELGAGLTLGAQRDPFFRTQVHWLGVWSLGGQEDRYSAARAGRIAVRAQGGAVVARDSAVLPSTQLFLTGGDASVRGYAYHEIGAALTNGQISPGRYLANGSVEWQRPISVNGQLTDWESTVFVDAGAVADKPSAFKAKVGVGVGARWKSPVGPLQMDVAYGVAVKRVRLHLSVGFTF